MHVINVIIPAYNEEASIGLVIGDIPAIVNQVIVVNNNSSDNTAQVAQSAGATVLTEKSKGYGYACLKAMRSEEHTSELQSRENLVCRLLLEKKNNHTRAPL